MEPPASLYAVGGVSAHECKHLSVWLQVGSKLVFKVPHAAIVSSPAALVCLVNDTAISRTWRHRPWTLGIAVQNQFREQHSRHLADCGVSAVERSNAACAFPHDCANLLANVPASAERLEMSSKGMGCAQFEHMEFRSG